MFINAGKTDIPIGTTIKIIQSAYPSRLGLVGTITHPFPKKEELTEAIAGFQLDRTQSIAEFNLMPGDLFEVVDPKTATRFPNETNEAGEAVYHLTGTYTLSHLQDLEIILAREAPAQVWEPIARDVQRAIGNTNSQRCTTCHRLLSYEDLARYPDSESQEGYQNGWYCADHEKRPEFQHPQQDKEGGKG